MTFVQYEFLVFMAIVFALYWAFPRRRWQNCLLLVASAIFYGWVHPWFLILLFTASTMDYLVGLGMERHPLHKKTLLVVSLVGNLGMLGFFKYFDFFITNVADVMRLLGMNPSIHALGIFLPVGISFYTFQTMSYTIDVYRGDIRARRDFLDYQLFVTFFPQLVAGPIERAGNLLSQIERDRSIDRERVLSGLSLALWGAFKKVCIADTLAPYVDKTFILSEPSGPLIWAATLGFAIQILTDFSGYTDIARGTARMLGFELMKNFDHPYLSKSPSEFWRRWHISFSSWIRDYLFIPLGGSRGGWLNTLKATFGAMLLSGFWHGASWTFVLWGAWHALLLSVYRFVKPRVPNKLRRIPAAGALQVILFFLFTLVGWMIFRETHIQRLFHYFTLSPFQASPDQWVATCVLLVMCAVFSLPLMLALLSERFLLPRIAKTPWLLPCRALAWSVQALAIFIFSRMSSNDFIYFQF